jgi:hypothetical protein
MLVEVFVEAEPRRRAREEAGGERRLAHGERVTPQIVAVQLHQVEGWIFWPLRASSASRNCAR